MRKTVICEAARHGQVGWGQQDDVLILMRDCVKRIKEGLKQGLLDVHDGSGRRGDAVGYGRIVHALDQVLVPLGVPLGTGDVYSTGGRAEPSELAADGQ
eukprot:6733974-Pyramimonas_sp.AAC.1